MAIVLIIWRNEVTLFLMKMQLKRFFGGLGRWWSSITANPPKEQLDSHTQFDLSQPELLKRTAEMANIANHSQGSIFKNE